MRSLTPSLVVPRTLAKQFRVTVSIAVSHLHTRLGRPLSTRYAVSLSSQHILYKMNSEDYMATLSLLLQCNGCSMEAKLQKVLVCQHTLCMDCVRKLTITNRRFHCSVCDKVSISTLNQKEVRLK